MSSVLTLRIPAARADEISGRVWAEPGVLGIQESPVGGASLFTIGEGFEVLEFGSEAAKRCAVWLENESFRKDAELLLKIYLDPQIDFDAASFVERVKGAYAVNLESFESLERTDYLANYKNSVQGAAFGDKLWIGPPWAQAPDGHHAFIVEPGLAFGTGGHPTTQLCFERLVSLSRESGPMPQSFLDLGTGSGILGVAVKRFFPRARLVVSDLDPLCREEVAKTFSFNNLPAPEGYFGPSGAAAQLVQSGLRVDCVVSNIYAEILAQIAPSVAALLPAGGRWIASGILRGPAEKELLKSIHGLFTVNWEESRAQSSSQLDSQGGLKAIQETWAAYELVKVA